MQHHYPSAESPKRVRRSAKALAGTVALAMVGFGGLAAITAVPAYALTTNNYTIGSPTGSVTNVTVSPTSVLSGGAGQSYTVTFTSPAALSYSVPDTITIGDSDGNAVATTATNVDLISGSCLQANDDSTASGPLVITLTSTACSLPAGATVEVTFDATNPGSNFNFTVYTSENGTATNSPTVTVSSVPPTLTPASESAGVNTTWTIDGIGSTGASGGSWATFNSGATAGSIELSTAGSNAGTGFYAGSAGYAVTVTPSGGTATSDAVSAATLGTTTDTVAGTPSDTVFLTLANAIAEGSTVNITAEVTNPLSGSVDLDITPGTITSSVFSAIGPTESATGGPFGSGVTAVTASISPLVAADGATYTVTFKATTATTAISSDIFVKETTGPTNFYGANTSSGGILVSDATAGWHYVVPTGTATPMDSCPGTCDEEIEIPTGGNVIAAGDVVTVTLVDVVNPAAGTYSDLALSTSSDPIFVDAPAYTIGAAGTSGVNVAVSPATVGSVATYTITGLYASAAISGGTANEPGNEITLTAESGTVFPDTAGDFSITDSTTASGSGSAAAVIYEAANAVAIVPANNIADGDLLTVTVADVINPSTSSSTDSMTILGPVQAETGEAPFPHANVTYPNGSIVNFSGTDYLFAGGHAFGIATPTLLTKLEAVDHAAVVTAAVGSILPTNAAREGTLITTNAVNANSTIYVVGADGELHGFATGAQYIGDGFDPALAVTVPMLGGITVGSTAGVEGSAVSAYALSADGAIVDSSGTYYVFDGGKAFGIPTPTWLYTVKKYDKALPLVGTVGSVQTTAGFANGALITVNNEVYVGFSTAVFPFKSQAQFIGDGYAGTASITAPTLGGLSAVLAYSGS